MSGHTQRDKASLRPVLGLAGFFGYGNYGDELFLRVFEEHLGADFDLRVLPDQLEAPYFSTQVEGLVAEVDAVLIGGGDLVQPWGMDPRYFNKAYLAKPVVVVGVGVPIRAATATTQQEKPHIVARYSRFFQNENTRLIHARDPQSASWIRSKTSPKVEVIEAPDIVCGLTLPFVRKPAGPPILGVVTRFRPRRDTPDDYSRIEEVAAHLQGQGWRVRQIILGTGTVGERDYANAADFRVPDKEIIRSENLDELTKAIGECTALASMKFHGTVVATMYGIPSVVMVATNKNRNFMNRIGRSDLLSQFDSPDLISKFSPPPAPINPDAVTEIGARARELLGRVRSTLYREMGAWKGEHQTSLSPREENAAERAPT
jgi:polysaccharide pyruvyl transferase WcaK-like protein